MYETRKIAIVGLGPRGHFAFERFLFHLVKSKALHQIEIVLFESTPHIGNGPVYDTYQLTSNWINVPERNLDIPARRDQKQTDVLPPFDSYDEWVTKFERNEGERDTYPSRAFVGKYLQERFHSLLQPMKETGRVKLINENVTRLYLCNDQLKVKTDNQEFQVDEVLLTIGHQPTVLSDQVKEWLEYSTHRNGIHFFHRTYPIRNYLNKIPNGSSAKIGIRGFGLAMIDVCRAITEKYGSFESLDGPYPTLKYTNYGKVCPQIIPFSLDGLPLAPKPINQQVDNLFQPTSHQLAALENIIGDTEIQQSATSPDFLIDAISEVVSEVYVNLTGQHGSDLHKKSVRYQTRKWLSDPSFESDLILSTKIPPRDIMQSFVKMACDQSPASLDYCIGQVWRHCQPSIFDHLSFNACSTDVFTKIIELHERMKRYTYGPPLESTLQLLALFDAEILDLRFVNDPKISTTENGWELKKGNDKITVTTMIDSVLDSPTVKKVNSSLVQHLLKNDLIVPAHDELGIHIYKNGLILSPEKDQEIPIAVLGRLAKGTVIGVDSIRESFGKNTERWAEAAAARHRKWLEKNNSKKY